jgi:hypothetical protein
MDATVRQSQQDKDNRTQSDLTSRVGTRMTRPEKSTTSRWSALRRLLRLGGGR